MSEDRMILDVVFHAVSGKSLLDSEAGIKVEDLPCYAASETSQEEALEELRRLGFEIVGPATPYGVSIAGPPALVKETFGAEELTVPESLAEWVEAVRVPPPVKFFGPANMGF